MRLDNKRVTVAYNTPRGDVQILVAILVFNWFRRFRQFRKRKDLPKNPLLRCTVYAHVYRYYELCRNANEVPTIQSRTGVRSHSCKEATATTLMHMHLRIFTDILLAPSILMVAHRLPVLIKKAALCHRAGASSIFHWRSCTKACR